MNALLKRKPAEPAPSWKNADDWAAQGYCVVQVPAWRADEFREPSENSYNAAIHHVGEEIRDRDFADDVGILAQKLPGGDVISNDWAMSTWLSVLRIDVRTDKKLVRDIEQIIAPHLRWAPSIETKFAPVRLTPDSSALLYPFRLDHRDAYVSPFAKTGRFKLPRDNKWAPQNIVSIGTAWECFTASHYGWRDGLDLRAVHISGLPLMAHADADAIIESVQRLLDERGVEPWA